MGEKPILSSILTICSHHIILISSRSIRLRETHLNKSMFKFLKAGNKWRSNNLVLVLILTLSLILVGSTSMTIIRLNKITCLIEAVPNTCMSSPKIWGTITTSQEYTILITKWGSSSTMKTTMGRWKCKNLHLTYLSITEMAKLAVSHIINRLAIDSRHRVK